MNKLDMIRKIKKYKEPPYRKDDSYFLRSPWYKFGTVGAYEEWYWFTNETILQQATLEDIIEAYKEITKFYFNKGENNNMSTPIKKSMFEEVKDRNVVLGSGDGDSQRFFRTVKDFVDFLSLPAAEEKKLDKVEKGYIKDVIRPFRDNVVYIKKTTATPIEGLFSSYCREQIEIGYKDFYNDDAIIKIILPPFMKDKMYKGMQINKEYTLEELRIKFRD